MAEDGARVSNDYELLTALQSWRRWHDLKGVARSDLPSDDDLRRLVNQRPRSAADVARMGVPKPIRRFLRSHSDEILELFGVPVPDPQTSDAAGIASLDAAGGASSAAVGGATSDAAAAPALPIPPVPSVPPAPPGPAGHAGRSRPPSEPPRKPEPVAASEPVETPAAETPAAEPPAAKPLTFAVEGFSPYTFDEPPRPPVPAAASLDPDGQTVTLSWPAAQHQPVALYRVVFSDSIQPYSPEDADLLVGTRETTATDTSPKRGVVRHYAVWVNTGTTFDDARASQPYLHARTGVVFPVTDASLRPDGGAVLGTWRCGEGAERVDVLRIPAAFAGTAQNDRERYGVARETSNERGFRDARVAPGETYVYRIFAVGLLDGNLTQSRPVVLPVTVPARLEAVADLVAEVASSDGEGRVVTLRWSRPAVGEVTMYRTADGPLPGAEEQTDATLENLQPMGLPDEMVLPYPQEPDGELSVMREVTWPAGWARVRFTPVTVHHGRVLVGRSVTLVEPNEIRDPRLVERVTWQHLTFAWPEGASRVKVYSARQGEALPPDPGAALADIDEVTYVKEGGLRLTGARALRTQVGVRLELHLVPVVFFDGCAYTRPSVTVPYAGLMVVRYRWRVVPAGRGLRTGTTGGSVVFEATSSLGRIPALRLIANRDRMPLSRSDGMQVAFWRGEHCGVDEWVPVPELSVPRPSGYVRIFADSSGIPVEVAVLDPPLEQLHVTET